MLDKITNRIMNQITGNLQGITSEQAEIIRYGIYLGFSDGIKVFVLLVISLFFGIFLEVLAAIISFGMLRMFLGGIHAKSQLECTLVYTVFIYGNIAISHFLEITYSNVLIFIIAFILAYMYAPADLPSKPLTSMKQRTKLKIIGIIMLVLLFLITFFIPGVFCNIISISTLTVVFMITPALYKITGNKRSKRG